MSILSYEEDIRHTEPDETGHRKARFRQGWRNALQPGEEYNETTLKKLTWENLGYRLGKLFGETDQVMIDELYEWCVRQQRGEGGK